MNKNAADIVHSYIVGFAGAGSLKPVTAWHDWIFVTWQSGGNMLSLIFSSKMSMEGAYRLLWVFEFFPKLLIARKKNWDL